MTTMDERRRARRGSGGIVPAALAAALAAAGAHAQPPHAAPEGWPCVQSYVPTVSAGRFWTGELPGDGSWQGEQDILLLAEELVSRKFTLEESLDKARKFFAAPENATRAKAGLLVGALTGAVNRERGKVLDGIRRFGKRQQMMAGRIEGQAKKLEQMEGAGDADEAELEDLQTRQKWDIRVFEERERMMSHLCEQPVVLEQRFFQVGRTVVSLLQGFGG
ncbi:MAG: hypothetical protein OXU83_07260 [Gammaproteobacteria bacterium]|nr:hypothetical protein [Gammaproteobacteria bacterium]